MADVLILHSTPGGPRDGPGAAALLARLPYARRLELARRAPEARTASLLGTALALAGTGRLRGSPVAASQLRFRPGSAPELPGGPWFSVSHSTNCVAVALSSHARVGLDVEDAASAAAAARSFAGSLERWTAIEAALKALGTSLRESRCVSLADDLSRAEVGGVTLRLRPVDLGAGCTAFLAAEVQFASVAVERVADPW
jgi:phosphopantetheinyl transferase